MKIIYFIYGLLVTIVVISCKKSSYLDTVPSQSLTIPHKLSDYQAILDNDNYMNGNSQAEGVISSLMDAASDDYYANNNINTMGQEFINLYKWNDEIGAINHRGWIYNYRSVFYANTVLDGISKLQVDPSQQTEFNNVKGSALFYRAHMFYQLAQVYAPIYDINTASSDLGIPLRLKSDINEQIERSTVRQTYDQVINDLKLAVSLLPVNPQYKTRPSKPAAYALLARAYLSMSDYNNAFVYADSSLKLKADLMNYNDYNSGNYLPFPPLNEEIIFQAVQVINPVTNVGTGFVDSVLYNSYDDNDLRKTMFYLDASAIGDVGYIYLGSYDQSFFFFSGIATDEIYLIRAECYARLGNKVAALNDLNTLLLKRWNNAVPFQPVSATGSYDALKKILSERRKELVFRGLRWTDLRRLNKEGANITIKRILDGQTYILPPNSLRYTFLIPPDVIGFNHDMQQNPR